MAKRIHLNRVCGYLKPKNEALFKGFTKVNELGVSEGINIILKDYFQRINEGDKLRYISNGNKGYLKK